MGIDICRRKMSITMEDGIMEEFKESSDDSRLPRRSRYVKNEPEKTIGPFQRYSEERLNSTESLIGKVKKPCTENLSGSQSSSSLPPIEDCEGTLEDINISSTNNLNSQLSESSIHTPSPELNSGYASWYYAEEQQQIVNMLREVNMRHERQLRRDMAARSDRPCSDDSTSSNIDPNSSDGLQRSLSSDDEDDGIIVLVSPEGDNSTADPLDSEDTKDLENDYLEKSVSDYFEEFQSIFTVSPEKNIINTLTKECMKESLAVADSNKADSVEEVEQIGNASAKEELLVQSEFNSHDSKDCPTVTTLKVENADQNKKMAEKEQKILSPSLPEHVKETGIHSGEFFSEHREENNTIIGNKMQTYTDDVMNISNFSSESSGSKKCSDNIEGEKCIAENKNRDIFENCSKQQNRKPDVNTKRNSPSYRKNYQLPTNYRHNASQSSIVKFVNELSMKNKLLFSLGINPVQSINKSHFSSTYHKPEMIQRLLTKSIKDFVPAPSISVENYSKNNNISHEHKTEHFQSCGSKIDDDNQEMPFWKKLPYFIQRNEFPEKKEVRSETNLSPRDVIKSRSNVEVTSFSDTCLPFKDKEMCYRRISVEELFQSATVSKSRDTKDSVNVQPFSDKIEHIPNEYRNLISATDHLKQILKIGTENKLQKCSSASEKYYEKDHCPSDTVIGNANNINKCSNAMSSFKRYDGESEKDSNLKNNFAGKVSVNYAQNNKNQNNSHAQDDFEKSKTSTVARIEDQNNISISRQTNRSNFTSKSDYSRKGYKQDKFSKFQHKEILPGSTASKFNDKNKSANTTDDYCRTEILSSKNSSSTDEKPRSKRKKKYKTDKPKVKEDYLKNDMPICSTSEYRDKRDLKVKSDYSTYNSEIEPLSSYEKLSYVSKDKYRSSWRDVKRADSVTTAGIKKEVKKYTNLDSLNIIKVKKVANIPGTVTKEDSYNQCKNAVSSKNMAADISRKEKQNSITSKHSNLSYSAGYSVNREMEDKSVAEPSTTHFEKKSANNATLNPHFQYSKSKNIKATQSAEGRALIKEKNFRMEDPSVESYSNLCSSKYNASPGKWWQYGSNSRYVHSYRNYHERACFERDRLSKSKRSDFKLKTDYKATYEKECDAVNLIDKEQYCQKENAFATDKETHCHTDPKSNSSSKTKTGHTTEFKEKFVLESIYSCPKSLKPQENNAFLYTNKLSAVGKAENKNKKEEEIVPDKDKSNSCNSNCNKSIKQEEKEFVKVMPLPSLSVIESETAQDYSKKANLTGNECLNKDLNVYPSGTVNDTMVSPHKNKIAEIGCEKCNDDVSDVDCKTGDKSIINPENQLIVSSHNVRQNISCMVQMKTSEIIGIESERGALVNSKQMEEQQIEQRILRKIQSLI
ncbi:uncharacterized protein TNIN_478171 [Trichonephila inaurata madagascariensis]|uniref:Uncharacterized protein n=1 Tax=Trichonephila inaurata madagascariensis TaxID=2747483 RepID=A0A8X6YFA9_9ARAC|nr:uncharacterized protein TNIN_478171 [Trichonephila inaurata madagascariensis]